MIDQYVTGSGGFIGKHLMPKLTGKTAAIAHDQISRFEMEPFRRMFFLSAYGNISGQDWTEQILRANVLDVGLWVEDMMYSNMSCEIFVYMSSSSVNLPVQTPYSRTKRAAEEMLQATTLPYCIVRPFSVTGRNEQKEHLIPTLIRSCLEGEEMELAPDPIHDFVDVEDLVNGILLLADQKATGIFELGSGLGWSNLDVMGMVEDITGEKANVKMVSSLRSYDNDKWYCRNFDAAKFGWVPRKTLAHSISEMVEAYKHERA